MIWLSNDHLLWHCERSNSFINTLITALIRSIHREENTSIIISIIFFIHVYTPQSKGYLTHVYMYLIIYYPPILWTQTNNIKSVIYYFLIKVNEFLRREKRNFKKREGKRNRRIEGKTLYKFYFKYNFKYKILILDFY